MPPDSTSAALSAPAAPPAAPVAAPAPAAGAPAAAAPPPGAVNWLTGADEITTGYAANKGWASPVDVVKSYQAAENLLGADRMGRTVVLPKPDASPEERAAFFSKLGRPSDANGYNLPVPEGGSNDFATAASAKFFELGIPQTTGQELTKWINDTAAGHNTSLAAQQQAARAADDVALRAEWGSAFDQNLTAARNAKAALGLDDKAIDAMSAAMGHGATLRMLAKAGAKSLEDGFVAGDNNNLGNAMTPGQAQAKIRELQTDREWAKRYLAGGATEKAEMARLQGFANPAPQS